MLCNIEVEKMVLASILLEPQKMDIAIAQGITPDSFANIFHRRLFDTMQRMAKEGKEIEIVSLSALMPNEEQGILSIVSSTPTTAYFNQWIQSLKEAETARFVLNIAKTAAGEIEKGNTPIATTLSRITAGTEAAAKSLSGLKAMFSERDCGGLHRKRQERLVGRRAVLPPNIRRGDLTFITTGGKCTLFAGIREQGKQPLPLVP